MSNPQRSTEEKQRLVENTMRMIFKSATDSHVFISADQRVSEKDAAVLLGYKHPGSLKNLRQAGQAPIHYLRPVNGSRVSYRLMDLAAWLEERREGW
ncbi:conserved hypothetical protein [Burkholderiales bacterium 8X]|nr:conserved hypothetical protein [Burkholderiales bacterium 8X]